jgi:hypothetical protein
MGPEMVVCPWNEFWQHYSPWTLSEAAVQQGVSALKTANILEGGEWAGHIDPTTGPNENIGFKSLQEIARNLERIGVVDRRRASYKLVHKPNQAARSTISSGNHKVDGYFYPIKKLPSDSTAALELRHSASVHEYKPKNSRDLVYDASLIYTCGITLG